MKHSVGSGASSCQQCALSSPDGLKPNTNRTQTKIQIQIQAQIQAQTQKYACQTCLPQNSNQSKKAACALIRLVLIEIHQIHKIQTQIFNIVTYTSKQPVKKICLFRVSDTEMV